ncbi:MAG: hypothetical protein WKG07_45795 [Hymenobacter sp.]
MAGISLTDAGLVVTTGASRRPRRQRRPCRPRARGGCGRSDRSTTHWKASSGARTLSGRPAAVRPAGSALVAIVRYTVRACVPAQRLLLLLPVAGALLFGLLSRLSDETAVTAFSASRRHGAAHPRAPHHLLIVGDALLGAEIRSGVFAFTWLSPVRYPTIVLGRWLGGCLIIAVILVPAAAAAAVVAGHRRPPDRRRSQPWPAPPPTWPCSSPSGPASAAGGLVSRTGDSRRAPARRCAGRHRPALTRMVGPIGPGRHHRPGHRPASEGHSVRWPAVGRLVLVTAVGLAVATRRLRSLRPASSAD